MYSYRPEEVQNVVFSISGSFMGSCQYPQNMSILENIYPVLTLERTLSMMGIGYESLIVLLFTKSVVDALVSSFRLVS